MFIIMIGFHYELFPEWFLLPTHGYFTRTPKYVQSTYKLRISPDTLKRTRTRGILLRTRGVLFRTKVRTKYVIPPFFEYPDF